MLYKISTAFAIYFVFWWIVLFLTLPFGVRSQHEDGEGAGHVIPGTDPGAPVAPRMGRKLIWTTLISSVLFAASMLAYNAGYLNVERLSRLLGLPF
jgi:predicted secreted protein